MKFNYLSISALFIFGLLLFTSCGKENIDLSSTEEEEVNPVLVVCNLEVSIGEQPPGSGDLYSNVNGGTAPFTYLWSTGETTANISVTEEGTFTVTVTDAEDCTSEAEITVSEQDPCQSFTAEVEETLLGTLNAITNGGTAPYTYSWSTGETTAEITVITDGTYFVTVTDDNGCSSEAEITVTLPDPCEVFLVEIEESPAGTLIANTSGGTAPYVYIWATGETTPTINVVSSGTYSVTVTDANGCVFVESINATGSDPCSNSNLTITISNPQATTLITAYDGGTAPYAFLWSTGETTSSISAPGSGTYSVTITDANGCIAEDDFELP